MYLELPARDGWLPGTILAEELESLEQLLDLSFPAFIETINDDEFGPERREIASFSFDNARRRRSGSTTKL